MLIMSNMCTDQSALCGSTWEPSPTLFVKFRPAVYWTNNFVMSSYVVVDNHTSQLHYQQLQL